jgi:hypothetical protein
MLRKVLVAGLVVVVSLVTISYVCPRAASHVKLWLKQRKQAAEDAVPPEQEIARLKMELENQAKEDDSHFDRVAKQTVAVQKLEKQVDGMRAALEKEERRIVTLKSSYDAAVKAEQKQVRHGDRSYDLKVFRSDLLAAAARFEIEEGLVKSKEEQLAEDKQTLEVNRRKLLERKRVRQQLRTDLARLERALASEKQAQAAEQNTLDDPSYQRLCADLDRVRDKVEVMKQKRILKGEIDGPVQAEKRKEQEAANERFLNERFSDKR